MSQKSRAHCFKKKGVIFYDDDWKSVTCKILSSQDLIMPSHFYLNYTV